MSRIHADYIRNQLNDDKKVDDTPVSQLIKLLGGMTTTDLVDINTKDILRVSQIKDVLKYIFGFLHSVPSLTNDQPDNQTNFAGVKNESDSLAETISILCTVDKYNLERFLYPEMLLIQADSTVDLSQTLPLRRESVVMSGASSLLVDCMKEIIIYRLLTLRHQKLDEFRIKTKFELLQELRIDLQRRFSIAPIVPSVLLSHAGEASSTFFSEKLIEDYSALGYGFSAYMNSIEKSIIDDKQA